MLDALQIVRRLAWSINTTKMHFPPVVLLILAILRSNAFACSRLTPACEQPCNGAGGMCS